MEYLQLVSILMEAVIFVVALMGGVYRKKIYGYLLALTFAIFVFYDLAKLGIFTAADSVLQIAFFIASLSALIGVWEVFIDVPKNSTVKKKGDIKKKSARKKKK